MRYCICITCLLFSFCCYGTPKKIAGRIVDENGKGISFCAVQLKGRNEGVMCDDNGNFSITVNTDSSQSLVFYCIGYEIKGLPFSKFSDSVTTVVLKRQNVHLTECMFGAKPVKGKIGEGVLGREH